MKLIKNPSNASIKNFNINGRLYTLLAGKQDAFNDDVAIELMRVYGFLEEVEIKEEQIKGRSNFKCPECDFVSSAKVAVLGHARKHGGSEKIVPEEIEVESEIKLQDGVTAISEIEKKKFGGEQNHVGLDSSFEGSGLTED